MSSKSASPRRLLLAATALLAVLLLLISCRALTEPVGQISALPASPTTTATEAATAPVVESSQSILRDSDFAVRLHPDGPLHVGDLVSIEVILREGVEAPGEISDLRVQVQAGEQALEEIGFSRHGIGRRWQATFRWAWDTAGLSPGRYTLRFSILPDGPQWEQAVELLDGNQLVSEPDRHEWREAESECCVFYYISGTKAESDLQEITEMAEEQSRLVAQELRVEIDEQIPIVLLPRVLGHGGFASSEIAVSYPDRDYVGGDPALVLRHEIVHLLDLRSESKFRPTLLVEGVAVYLSGGHFKEEALLPRAAALLPPSGACGRTASLYPMLQQATCGLGGYMPLRELTEYFYLSPHEAGYLQAGALVEYLVEQWGWDTFYSFYREMELPEGSTQAEAFDQALQQRFGITLEELEGQFLQVLRRQPLEAEHLEDVRLTLEQMDTVRRYQQILDPSAYFLYAWIPSAEEMRERGIVADYLRRPDEPFNASAESLLYTSGEALLVGDYARAGVLLNGVNALLDAVENQKASRLPAGK